MKFYSGLLYGQRLTADFLSLKELLTRFMLGEKAKTKAAATTTTTKEKKEQENTHTHTKTKLVKREPFCS